MSSYDYRATDNYEVLQARQRAQQQRDRSFSMLGTAGLYNRRGQPIPSKRDVDRQQRMEELQRQQYLQQMQLQEQLGKELEKEQEIKQKRQVRQLNGIAVLQNHDEKLEALEDKIANIVSNMQNADSIFKNINNKNNYDFNSFEKKLEQLEQKLDTGGLNVGSDFEAVIIKRLHDSNVAVAKKLEEFESNIKNIKKFKNNSSTGANMQEVTKLVKDSETGVMQVVQNMEKSINKRIDSELEKKIDYFDSKMKAFEQQALQTLAATGGGSGGGPAALAMINRVRDELGDRMSAMERQGGGHGGMGKTAERFLQQQKTKLDKASHDLKELQSAYRTRELEVNFMFNKLKDRNQALDKQIISLNQQLDDKNDKSKTNSSNDDEKSQQNVQLEVTE